MKSIQFKHKELTVTVVYDDEHEMLEVRVNSRRLGRVSSHGAVVDGVEFDKAGSKVEIQFDRKKSLDSLKLRVDGVALEPVDKKEAYLSYAGGTLVLCGVLQLLAAFIFKGSAGWLGNFLFFALAPVYIGLGLVVLLKEKIWTAFLGVVVILLETLLLHDGLSLAAIATSLILAATVLINAVALVSVTKS